MPKTSPPPRTPPTPRTDPPRSPAPALTPPALGLRSAPPHAGTPPAYQRSALILARPPTPLRVLAQGLGHSTDPPLPRTRCALNASGRRGSAVTLRYPRPTHPNAPRAR